MVVGWWLGGGGYMLVRCWLDGGQMVVGVGWMVVVGWLVGWLVGCWLVGGLVGCWLVGWLVDGWLVVG